MKLLDRTPEHVEADARRYEDARRAALATGLVPLRRPARVADFVERAITEVESLLTLDHDEETREQLEARLAHLKEERDRLV